MSNDLMVGSSFVAPHFIEELGEEGLTLHEVARSLGIEFKEAKRVLEKNISDYQTVEISTLVNHPVTGQREVVSYALTTEDAKFFVAGYNNEIGKSYRRYLIQCEKAVQALRTKALQTPHAKAEEILGVFMRVGALFGAPTHLVQIEAVKEAHKSTGVDFSPVLKLAPAQDDVATEDVMLEPTELATELGFTSAVKMNRCLADAGLQVKTGGMWEPTTAGKPMCIKHAWKEGTKSGYNLKWNLTKVSEFLRNAEFT